ncbi:folate-binding protein YgfZ [Methylocapsa sp. S129]|uniref:CAF17-like 4Fe-4S cluster assembly/insertion protein YgfZ n=1 Tax=Methylocapsa sp. S129 TaxID=1641869 RepID=UPI00352AD53E
MHRTLLEDRGVLRVAGEDSASFLQGLLTNDVEGLAVGAARYAALLSPQGKILFDFLVLRVGAESGKAFLVDCPAAQAGELAKRLGFYRLRAKVTISDESADHAVIAVWKEGEQRLEQSTAMTDGAAEGLCYVDPRDPRLGSRAILPRAQAAALANSDVDDYEAHRIKLGVPKGGVDFAYADIFPHDANLDLLHGVDFEKGCYVGQEVVSRMHHRGGARKRIVRLTLAGAAPERGTPVLAGETSIGTLGSAANGRALALMRLDKVEDAQSAGRPLTTGGVGVTTEEK